jgi:hypothetical protein
MNVTPHLLIAVAMTFSTSLASADAIIYPAQGQSPAKQQDDEGQCFVWAREQTGFDPLAQSTVQAAPVQQRQGGAVRGAARGAAVGAIVGNSDDAKKGAAIGAAAGRMRQNRSNRAASEQAQTQQSSAQASQDAGRSEYDRAYAVCLEGRGYTVR